MYIAEKRLVWYKQEQRPVRLSIKTKDEVSIKNHHEIVKNCGRYHGGHQKARGVCERSSLIPRPTTKEKDNGACRKRITVSFSHEVKMLAAIY